MSCLETIRGKAGRTRLAFLFVFLATGAAAAQSADAGWELRFCADPNAWPFSSADEPGFENGIAALVADELGATLTTDWHRQDESMVRDRLNGGECDVIAGVPDEIDGLTHTVAYYSSPYVFVYRDDLPLSQPLTLDSPDLADLRIGAQVEAMPPHEGLLTRGLGDRVVFEGLTAVAGGNPEDVLDELDTGGVDIALAWGPVAGAWLLGHDGYAMTPVTPEFEVPFLQQVVPMTMAVRQGDLSLRDDLNAAIAARWDDIQEELTRYGVPLGAGISPGVPMPLPYHTTLAIIAPADLRPAPLDSALYGLVGEAAYRGAQFAEEDLIRADSDSVELLRAIAPNADAAARAAARIASLHEPAALLGGVGPGQLAALMGAGVPVVNVGEPVTEDADGIFSAQASREMYFEAMIGWFGGDETRWHVLHEASAEGQDMLAGFTAALERMTPEATVTGSSAVPPASAYFEQVIAEASAEADVVAVLLDPRDQISFLAQLGGTALTAAPYPYAVNQTRDYLASVAVRAGLNGGGEHLVLFEPLLPESEALNAAFVARWGAPMEPSAWSGWLGVRAVVEAIGRAGEDWSADLPSYLFCAAGEESFAMPVVRINPEADFERTVAGLSGVAAPVGEVGVACP